MNEILLLILTWLPIPVEVAGFIVVLKVMLKEIVKKLEIPDKLVKVTDNMRKEMYELNKANAEIIALNKKLLEDNEQLKLQLKGVIAHGKERFKKN